MHKFSFILAIVLFFSIFTLKAGIRTTSFRVGGFRFSTMQSFNDSTRIVTSSSLSFVVFDKHDAQQVARNQSRSGGGIARSGSVVITNKNDMDRVIKSLQFAIDNSGKNATKGERVGNASPFIVNERGNIIVCARNNVKNNLSQKNAVKMLEFLQSFDTSRLEIK